ncbi:MAG: hypothetical protein Kow0013_27060 [Pararhodobacter sp.]
MDPVANMPAGRQVSMDRRRLLTARAAARPSACRASCGPRGAFRPGLTPAFPDDDAGVIGRLRSLFAQALCEPVDLFLFRGLGGATHIARSAAPALAAAPRRNAVRAPSPPLRRACDSLVVA